MRRTDRDNALCFKNLEQEISEHPEAYGHIDLLCAGWPCQDNSIAGKRAGHQGKRSGLWTDLVRLIGLFYPKWLILENVPGLLSVREGQDFKDVLADLDQMSYCVAIKVLDSQYFGIAQRRKRVFLVGSFGNIGASKVFLEQKGGGGDVAKGKSKRSASKGKCLSVREGQRQNFGDENIIVTKIGTITAKSYGDKGWAPNNEWNTVVASTLGATPRGNTSFVWQDTYIAETNPDRKRKIAGTPRGLDACRGIVIGNAVTIPVVEWIAKRIIEIKNENSSPI